MKIDALHDTLIYFNHMLEVLGHYFFPKAMFSILFVVYAFLFGVTTKEVLIGLMVLIIIDFIMGVSAAKLRGEPIMSSKVKHTALKICAYYAVIASAHVTEKSLVDTFSLADEMVIAFFSLTEFISILENAGRMGFSTPKKLLNQVIDMKNNL